MAIRVEWSDKYCIDHDIDVEHKRLFALANEVFALGDPKRELSQLKDAINALYQYMEVHFGNEERLMRQVGFPECDSHAAAHRAIIVRMNRLMTASRDLAELISDLRHLMTDWLLVHILTQDREIAAYAQHSSISQ